MAALPSFSDKTLSVSSDKLKSWRDPVEETTQITTATIQGFARARKSCGHCLASVSYFLLLWKWLPAYGWHFLEQSGKALQIILQKFSIFVFCWKLKSPPCHRKESLVETKKQAGMRFWPKQMKDDRGKMKVARCHKQKDGQRILKNRTRYVCAVWCGTITLLWHYDISRRLNHLLSVK